MAESRLALVTGAAHGMGRAIAERLARDGRSLVVADIELNDANRAAEEMRGAGYEAFPLALDFDDEHAVARAYSDIDTRYGRLDILVNSAGSFCEHTKVESISLDAWERVIRANLTSVFLMSRGAIPLMRRGGWGRIVNLSSASARGQPGAARGGYVAAKSGIIALSRVLADDLGHSGITVNCVAPSPLANTATLTALDVEQEDGNSVGSVLGRFAEPGDIAAGVAWLCSERASFFTGIVLDINGGMAMR